MANAIWIGTDSGNEGDINTAANWSGAAVPQAGDDVYFEDSSQDANDGLAALAAVALTSLNIARSYTGDIGVDSAGTYFQFLASTIRIGYHDGPGSPAGSGRLMLDCGATAAVITVEGTGSASDTNKPPMRLKCAAAGTTIEVRKGSVGIAWEIAETSTIGTVTVNYTTNTKTDADVFIGSGVTLTTLNCYAGETSLGCAATTVTSTAGTLTTTGSGAITTLNVRGGTAELNSTGTITTCNITGGTVDCAKSAAARTVTTLKLDAPGKLKYDPSIVTLTNKVQPFTATGLITYTGS